MAEPHLHLLGVEAVAEEHRRAGVPEGVERGPGHSRLSCGGFEHAVVDTGVVEWCSCAGGEDRVAVFCVVARTALLLERVEHAGCEGDVAASVAALGCVDAVVEPPPYMQSLLLDVEVAPAQPDRFAEAQPRMRKELDEEPRLLRELVEQAGEFG